MVRYHQTQTHIISSVGDVFKIVGSSTKLLKPSLTAKGYHRVCINGRNKMLHRVVAEAFIPNPNNYPQVNHKNGIKTDNRVKNLEWCTGSMNQQHAYDSGLKIQYRGEDHGRAKLTWGSVTKIRRLYAGGGETFKSLGTKFGVAKSNIEFILKNKTWVI